MKKQAAFLFIFIAYVSFPFSVAADVQRETLIGFFDLDDVPDKLTYSYTTDDGASGVARIEIRLGVAQKGNKAIIRNYNMVDTNMSISSKQKGEIVIFEAGDVGSGGAVSNYYKFNSKKEDWFLVKSVSEINTLNYLEYSDFAPLKITVVFHSGTNGIGGAVIAKEYAEVESDKGRSERSLLKLSELHDNLMDLYKKKQMSSIRGTFYDTDVLAEIVNNVPITKDNVELYNNIGFFLSQKEDARWAALYVLGEVVEKVPDRVAAYINIGDTFYSVNEKERAKIAYKKYMKLSKQLNNEIAMPRRVIERINESLSN